MLFVLSCDFVAKNGIILYVYNLIAFKYTLKENIHNGSNNNHPLGNSLKYEQHIFESLRSTAHQKAVCSKKSRFHKIYGITF